MDYIKTKCNFVNLGIRMSTMNFFPLLVVTFQLILNATPISLYEEKSIMKCRTNRRKFSNECVANPFPMKQIVS